jgi:outer membrane receptor protein involved in Fe transport
MPLRGSGLAVLVTCSLTLSIPARSFAFALTAHPSQVAETRQTPASETHEVSGTVADAAGLPIPGVVVLLRNVTTGLQRSDRTDPRGRFAFRGLAEGRYELTASSSGFTPAREVRTVPGEGEAVIQLTPAVYEESVTIVSETRTDRLRDGATAAVTVLEGADMRSAAYETVSDALAEVAGVLSRRGSEGTSAGGEQIQGIDSRQVLVLVDGQPIVGARGIKSGVINLDRESTRGLDRVEIVKGAASALYGSDAMGGVINLIPREPRRPVEVGVGVSGGNFGAADGSADVGAVRSWGTVFVSGGQHQRDAFDLTPSTPDTTGASIRRNNLAGRVTAAVGAGWAIAGNATRTKPGPTHRRSAVARRANSATARRSRFADIAADTTSAPKAPCSTRHVRCSTRARSPKISTRRTPRSVVS